VVLGATMSYCTLAELKKYLSISSDSEDDLLTASLNAATQQITTVTGRCFGVDTETTEYVRSTCDNISPNGRVLYLFIDRKELASAPTKVMVAGTDVTSAIKYYGNPPYDQLVLSKASGYRFDTISDEVDEYENIAITGLFGYSTSIPDDIKQAALIWSAYLYQLKDMQPDDKIYSTDTSSEQLVSYPSKAIALIEAYRKKV
jgi:hypothetical protein